MINATNYFDEFEMKFKTFKILKNINYVFEFFIYLIFNF